jgi:23S rRNA-/tRNA-specific pseudouridylate synthase
MHPAPNEYSVLYRDDAVLVVEKPSGLPSQPTQDRAVPDLYSLLSGQENYVGLHHRLDTPTSGLMLFTLDRRANAAVADGFKTGAIHRAYQLVVVGNPGSEGHWNTDIAGRSASTRWMRLATGGGMSVLSATLETGRTHQIRIHASGAGHPVVGDRRHGGAAARLWPRMALHAIELSFKHPTHGEAMVVTGSIPSELMDLWRNAGMEDASSTP